MTEQDICTLIRQDKWMMNILRTTRTLQLPEWWIGAGFVRNKVWDTICALPKRTLPSDIDVVYFDKKHLDENTEKTYDAQLRALLPGLNWSCKNQARMTNDADEHHYVSLIHALSEWPETATSVAVKLGTQDEVQLLAPHGIHDLVHLYVRPTPVFMKQREMYEKRQAKKNWAAQWPKLTFFSFTT